MGTRTSRSIMVHDVLGIEIKIIFQKLTLALNLTFNAK